MLNPLTALGRSLRDLFDDFFLIICCNLIWFCATAPLWAVALFMFVDGQFWLAALVTMLGTLPAGPLTMGLVAIAWRLTDGRVSGFRDFFGAVWRHARAGWILFGSWMLGFLLILFNLIYYGTLPGWVGVILTTIAIYLLIFWLSLLIYAPALFLLQEAPTPRTIIRSSTLMILGRPIFTMLTLAMMGLILLISFYLVAPLALLTMGWLALWGMQATRQQIADAKRREQEASAATLPPEERGRRGQVRPK